MKTMLYIFITLIAFTSCHKSSTVTHPGITKAVWHVTDAPLTFYYSADSLQQLNGSTYAYQRINGDTILLIGTPEYYVLHIYANGDSLHICNRFSWQNDWEYSNPGFKSYRVSQ